MVIARGVVREKVVGVRGTSVTMGCGDWWWGVKGMGVRMMAELRSCTEKTSTVVVVVEEEREEREEREGEEATTVRYR
jgi:hypothetical protein